EDAVHRDNRTTDRGRQDRGGDRPGRRLDRPPATGSHQGGLIEDTRYPRIAARRRIGAARQRRDLTARPGGPGTFRGRWADCSLFRDLRLAEAFRPGWMTGDDRSLRERTEVLAPRTRPTMSPGDGHRTIPQEQRHDRRTRKDRSNFTGFHGRRM